MSTYDPYERGWAEAIEAAMKKMDQIGCDWRDAGDMTKFYATNYLVEQVRALLKPFRTERGAEAIEAALYGPEPIRVEGQTVVLICKDNWEAKVLARSLLPSQHKQEQEIERLRAKEKDWMEVFEAQKSIIGRLTDTLLEIKRTSDAKEE